MSIREAMNRHTGLTKAAAFFLIAVAVVAAVDNFSPAGEQARNSDTAYFSDDNGATYFEADASSPSGFDHDGRPAYRAYVFKAEDGEPFVGYLERLTPEAEAKLQALTEEERADPRKINGITQGNQQIRAPGDERWLDRTDPAARRVLKITAPDGTSENLEPVMP
ncbi:MAG: hypothetical protein ACFCVE_14895 [Phycisphaerae bacterium]